MQVHNGVIGPLVLVDHRIGVQTHNQVVAFGTGFLQEIKVANMEQIESTSHVNNPIARLR